MEAVCRGCGQNAGQGHLCAGPFLNKDRPKRNSLIGYFEIIDLIENYKDGLEQQSLEILKMSDDIKKAEIYGKGSWFIDELLRIIKEKYEK